MRARGVVLGTVLAAGCAVDEPVYTALEVGRRAACALTSDTELVCSGEFDAVDATVAKGMIEAGTGAPSGPGWVDVALGAAHGCAIDADGAVTCWGDDVAGEASPYDGAYDRVEAGLETTCGFTTAGDVQCWGRQPDVDLSGTIADLELVQDRGCALTGSGDARCWGDLVPITGSYTKIGAGCGLLEDGDVECFYTALLSQQGPFVDVTVGSAEACAVADDGALWCWEELDAGRDPVGAPVADVSCGVEVCGALLADGTVTFWGPGAEAIDL